MTSVQLVGIVVSWLSIINQFGYFFWFSLSSLVSFFLICRDMLHSCPHLRLVSSNLYCFIIYHYHYDLLYLMFSYSGSLFTEKWAFLMF